MEAIAKKEVPVMEVESGESSTEEAEVESPRSVVIPLKKKLVEGIHSQVLKIREEESHLGEDFFGVDKENENETVCSGGSVAAAVGGFHEKLKRRRRRVSVILVSKPILPRSPLSGKTKVRTPPCPKAT